MHPEDVKDFIYDSSLKKKNNFWCSSTFWVPCTKKVGKERNILTKNSIISPSLDQISFQKSKLEGKPTQHYIVQT